MCVDQPDFMRIMLLTEFFNTHMHQRKSRTMQQVLQGFGTIYIEDHRRVLDDILNIVSNNCKYGSCGFCLTFPCTLNVPRFCGCVFSVFRLFHSKQGFVTRFLNRFCGYSCFDL
jgi:hypothetical protein